MSRFSNKCRISRRLGVNLWGDAKSRNLDKKPGQHGESRQKLSDYGVQLQAKQKLKNYYGRITETQFRRIYQEAVRLKGDSSKNLIGLLESRLVAAVYHMKFAKTVFAARQMISHGHIKVNGKRVDIASYSLRKGDVVEVIESMREKAIVLEALGSARTVPSYLTVDEKAVKGVFNLGTEPCSKRTSARFEDLDINQVPYPVTMDPQLIIEYYSK